MTCIRKALIVVALVVSVPHAHAQDVSLEARLAAARGAGMVAGALPMLHLPNLLRRLGAIHKQRPRSLPLPCRRRPTLQVMPHAWLFLLIP